MTLPTSSQVNEIEQEEIRELTERLSALTLRAPNPELLQHLPPRRDGLSCFSFLRSVFSSPRPVNARPTARPFGTAQSDPGTVPTSRRRPAFIDNRPLRAPLSTVPEETVLPHLRNDTNVLDTTTGDYSSLLENYEADALLGNLSPGELQKVYDESVKRAEKAALPPGGLFKGSKDSRSVLSFLQECERTPSWDIGYGPSAAFFQGRYLERCLSDEIRQTVVDGVDKYLVEQGYRSYRKAIRRGASIRSDLVKRFLSIESRRVLVDRWEKLCWDSKREGFDQFFLRFDYTRMALDAQRGAPFTKEDVADRLFNSLPDDLCEDILRRYGNSPSLEELKEAAERHNAVLQRRVNHGRQSRQAAVDVINEDTALTMPVDSETPAGEGLTVRLRRKPTAVFL